MIANPDEATATPPGIPFVTLISTATHAVLGTIIYDGGSGKGHGPSATAGIEQPVWDPVKDIHDKDLSRQNTHLLGLIGRISGEATVAGLTVCTDLPNWIR